jgi:ABC-type multidrug transport system fused ATPase/permease subunit
MMAQPADPEKELKELDPVGIETNNAAAQNEPVASPPTPSASDDSTYDDDIHSDDKYYNPEKAGRPTLSKIKSHASGISEYSQATQSTKPLKRTTWERINPLKRNPPPVPDVRQPSREHTAGFFSLLTFHWITPIMETGYKRPLEYGDLWEVNPERAVTLLSTNLMKHFHERRAKGSKQALCMAIYDTLKKDFIIGGAMQLIASLLQVFSPFLLRYLISFASKAWYAERNNTPAPHIGHGIGLVVGISIMQIIQTLCMNHFIYRGMMNGGMARAMLMSVIFDKAMVLSGRAKAGGKALDGMSPPDDVKPGSKEEKNWYTKMLKKKLAKKPGPGFGGKNGVDGDGQGWSNGRIINLMSTDTYRIDTAFGMFHMLWTAPIQILVTLILLLVNLSYSALAGFALIVLSVPLLTRAIRSLFKRRMGINKITDQRVSLTQEILQAVRFVKFFGWEVSFLDRIFELRKREVRSIQWLLATRNAINAVSMSMPIFASMLSFITYSLSNHNLDPAPVFSSLALFNALRMPLNFLPLVLGQVIDGLGSANRIEEFLLAEEQGEDIEFVLDMTPAIEVNNADFTWERERTQDLENTIAAPGPGAAKKLEAEKKAEKKADKKSTKQAAKEAKQAKKNGTPLNTASDSGMDTASTLTANAPFKITDINLNIGRNELIAVIGSVGSGKSSLLAALAGDMRKTEGQVKLGSHRAFCPQYAWIQNATVKDNICFGREFRQDWYDKVVDAAALRPDFEMLPDGDLTEIGERGITVSGGQKQRLNIARAIYFDADIIIMDDPLSAVDAHVGRHILDNAICGLLANKCRILATHQLWVLNRCDRIVWMEDGHIQAVDTYDNLIANHPDFQKLMANTAVEDEKETGDHVNDDEVEEVKKDVKKKKNKTSGLMTTEERAVSSVGWTVYAAYIKAAGGYWVAPLIGILLILTQGSNIATSLWLSWWTSNALDYPNGYYVSAWPSVSH